MGNDSSAAKFRGGISIGPCMYIPFPWRVFKDY
jgi:hypothetical protein